MTVLRSGSATDVGRVRTVNQDLPLEAPNLYAVADGMGGHVAGEVAARVAIDTLRSAFGRHPSVDGLREAVTEANVAVWQQGQTDSDLHGMGTTITALALVAGAARRDVGALANVGDSRAYVYSGARMVQITDDHSLAEEKVRQGEMTPAEAAVHPHRHILTRALGVGSDVNVDLWELQVRTGDRLVLCSDGLSNEVDPQEMAAILAATPDPQGAAEALVARANEHGGNDNITVVVVDVLVGGRGETATVIAPLLGAAAGTAMVVASGTGAAAPPGPAPTTVTPATAVPPSGTPAPPSEPTDEITTMTPAVGGTAVAPTGVVRAVPPGAQGAPIATGTIAVIERPAGSPGPPIPQDEGWMARRRRLGVPRSVTFRVFLFVLLLIGVVVAAYAVVRWYATDNYYVTVDNQNRLVIYQGRPGGLMGFNPKVVETTDVTTATVRTDQLANLKANVEEPTLAAARQYIRNLQSAYAAQQLLLHPPPTTTVPTTVPPPTPTTKAPPGSPAVVPGTTTTTPPPTTTTPSTAATTTTTAT